MRDRGIDAARHLLILKEINVVSMLRFIKKSVLKRLQPLEDIIYPHPGAGFLKQARKKILAWFSFFFSSFSYVFVQINI